MQTSIHYKTLGLPHNHNYKHPLLEQVGFKLARISIQHRERYQCISPQGEESAELIGNLRFNATSKSALPQVGDWVIVQEFMPGQMLIHFVLPRKQLLKRKAAGSLNEQQPIAANVDFGIIVQSCNRDLNHNRIERYLALCHNAQVSPIILLNKTDLWETEPLQIQLNLLKHRFPKTRIFAISCKTKAGLRDFIQHLEKGKTYCLLGSSGVGKSSLTNLLLGSKKMETQEIGSTSNRGKHKTTHRQLHVLDQGAILIDNPGIRELCMRDEIIGLDNTFDEIQDFAKQCRFSKCTHIHEVDCGVLTALANGNLSQERYSNYLKLFKEIDFYAATTLERKRNEKDLSRLIRVNKRKKKR